MDVKTLTSNAMIGATFARITLRSAAHRLRSAATLLSDDAAPASSAAPDLSNDDGLKMAERLANDAANALEELKHAAHSDSARELILRTLAGQLRAAADLLNTEFPDASEELQPGEDRITKAQELARGAAETIAKQRADTTAP